VYLDTQHDQIWWLQRVQQYTHEDQLQIRSNPEHKQSSHESEFS